MARRSLSRRAVLGSGAAIVSAGLAGCGSGGGATVTPTPQSPFVRTSFDGPDLVVELRDDHEVSPLNLIGPDGSLFESTEVAAGATTARLRLLNIEPRPLFSHYTPGIQRLVAVSDERTHEWELDLWPDLRIVDVQQYREGDNGYDFGHLAMTIENLGTGPTWVYQITYRDAPNWTVNDELIDNPGISWLLTPERPEDLILGPGERDVYIGETLPLLFIDEPEPECQGSVEFTVIVGTAVDEPIEQQIRANLGGEVMSAGLSEDYTCSEVEIEL